MRGSEQAHRLLRADQSLYGSRQLVQVVGLGEQREFNRRVRDDVAVAGRQKDRQFRPTAAQVTGEGDPVHLARHHDIGKDEHDAIYLPKC